MKYSAGICFALLAVSAPAQASVTHYFDAALPSNPMDLTGPTPTSASGAILFGAPVGSGVPGATYVGLKESYAGVARSPFETMPSGTFNAPPGYYGVSSYTSVSGGGSACFGTCTTFGEPATFARVAAVQSSGFGSGGDTLSFVYGSPDVYNTLTIFLDDGSSMSFTGNQIANTPQTGYVTEHFAGLGGYHGVEFSSTANSFEFSVVSPVPLPASAPLFGAALLALGTLGYGLKRKARTAA